MARVRCEIYGQPACNWTEINTKRKGLGLFPPFVRCATHCSVGHSLCYMCAHSTFQNVEEFRFRFGTQNGLQLPAAEQSVFYHSRISLSPSCLSKETEGWIFYSLAITSIRSRLENTKEETWGAFLAFLPFCQTYSLCRQCHQRHSQ